MLSEKYFIVELLIIEEYNVALIISNITESDFSFRTRLISRPVVSAPDTLSYWCLVQISLILFV